MNGFTCNQTIARDRLQRQLDWMDSYVGFRRRLLNLFYDTGTLWTWHTVLGIVLVGIPYTVLLGICIVGAASVFLCSIPIVWSLDLAEDILGWFANRALRKYRRVKRDRDEIIASGNTEP